MNNEPYVLITGGTTGIGYCLANLFARQGHNLFLVARNEDKLIRVKSEMENKWNIKVKIKNFDLSVDNSCAQLCDYVDKNKLYIKYLVNNAGVGSFGEFKEIELKRDLDIIDINIKSLTYLSKHFLYKMSENKEGGILNVGSTAAFCAGPKMATYYASKAYVLSLTEALYEEGKNYGVQVSCLCPGAVDTKFQKSAGIVKSKVAMKNIMDPKFVAEVGYNGFMKGNVLIIPGIKNKVLVLANKLIPRSISRKIIMKMNS